jgi:hypothetical protein
VLFKDDRKQDVGLATTGKYTVLAALGLQRRDGWQGDTLDRMSPSVEGSELRIIRSYVALQKLLDCRIASNLAG